jgi:hypothetical protein
MKQICTVSLLYKIKVKIEAVEIAGGYTVSKSQELKSPTIIYGRLYSLTNLNFAYFSHL